MESIILPGNKTYPKLRNTCVYLNRILYGANSLTDLFSSEGEEDCNKDTVKFSGRNERGNFNDIGDCYNITINIYICNKNINILQTRGFLKQL